MDAVTLHHGDALDVLRGMADNSVDAVVTDPPSGIGFMGKTWDHDHGGREGWVAAFAAIFAECLRVTKPGGHAFVWALPRTSHWTACALEDAGWEVREKVYHLFGSGFPKSHDVGKAIDAQAFRDWLAAHPDERAKYDEQMRQAGDNADARAHVDRKWRKAAGAEREVVGEGPFASRRPRANHDMQGLTFADDSYVRPPGHAITAPATDAARQWDGWGTALKPAAEEWILARKPLVGTVAANVQQYGTGALNIAASRVGTEDNLTRPYIVRDDNQVYGKGLGAGVQTPPAGRWPPNVALSHAPGCERVGTRRVRGHKSGTRKAGTEFGQGSGWNSHENRDTRDVRPTDADGFEAVDDWRCVDGCAVRALAEQSGERGNGYRRNPSTPDVSDSVTYGMGGTRGERGHNDTGTAARFFPNFEPSPLDDLDAPWLYTAKASRREREAGLEGMEERRKPTVKNSETRIDDRPGRQQGTILHTPTTNSHPCVKPLSLCRWLVRLVTPPVGVVLDPFMGSGTTGMAAVMEGFAFIGVEQDAEYIEIARRRIAWAQEQQPPLLRATGD